jgi:hypothetical protein
MSTRFTAKIGDVVTLEAKFELDGVLFDVFEFDKVELLDSELAVVESKEGSEVTQVSTGLYSIEFGPLTAAGVLSDNWIYRSVEDAELQTLILNVTVEDVEGSAGDSGGESETFPVAVPLPDENLCHVTHRFFDAGGDPLKGVFVRFRPNIMPADVPTVGSIAKDIDGVSNVNGELIRMTTASVPTDPPPEEKPFKLVRGTTGVLAVTGIGLVREVTVPDVATTDLFDLLATADDPLEVQEPQFFKLIRRS